MKINNFKKKIIILLSLLLLSVGAMLALSSCDEFSSYVSYNSIEATYINEKGELIVEYTNGKTENLGVVKGQDGVDGIDGKDGQNGLNGKDGEKGEKGDPGAKGENGNDGKDGSITISGGGADISIAGAKAMRSAVNVICGYNPLTSTYSSAGSGVVYKYNEETDGYFVITNYHVVYDTATKGISTSILLMSYGSEYVSNAMEATYVGGSMNYDIAVLYIENDDFVKGSTIVPVDVFDSNKLTIGQQAIAVGNPSSGGLSVTSGIISVDSETITMLAADESTEVDFRVLRTDTPINRGNSGGGLFNTQGQLIGIVNAKTIVDGVEGMGYAIPSTLACNVADNIIDNCFNKPYNTARRALFGITITISESKSVYDPSTGIIGIEETVIIKEATSTSLMAGRVQENDVIKSISLEGREPLTVTRQFHVIDYMLQARVGDTGTITIERTDTQTGQTQTLELTFQITPTCIANY